VATKLYVTPSVKPVTLNDVVDPVTAVTTALGTAAPLAVTVME
jgi:hypothetical protein